MDKIGGHSKLVKSLSRRGPAAAEAILHRYAHEERRCAAESAAT